MTFQGVATALIVAGAVAYLVWKIGLAPRARRVRRPDVPASALVRKKPRTLPEAPSPDKPGGGG